MARKYSKKASEKIGRTMHEFKQGTLKSGGSGKKVRSRKQAIAIGISQARRAGYKVPTSPPGHATKKTPAQLDREIAETLSSRTHGGGYRVAYSAGSPVSGRLARAYVESAFATPEAALPTLRSFKRRAFDAWVEDDAGNLIPVAGAKGRPRWVDALAPGEQHIQAVDVPKKRGKSHATIKDAGPSWKEIAEDYKRRAKAAREAGGKVKIYPDGSILVVPTEGSDEYFYQDWQADEFRADIERRNREVLDHIRFEDLVLAQAQNW